MIYVNLCYYFYYKRALQANGQLVDKSVDRLSFRIHTKTRILYESLNIKISGI